MQLKLEGKRIYLYIFLVLLVFALLNLFFNIPNIQRFLTRPVFAFPSTDEREGSFNPSRRANYLVFGLDDHKQVNRLIVATFGPEDQEVDFISVNPKVYSNLAYGFGYDCLCVAFFKGDFQPNPKGIDILYQSVSDELSIPFDGYIYLAEKYLSREALLGVKKNITGVGNLWKIVGLNSFLASESRTNLPLSKLFKIYQKLTSVRSDKYNYIELGKDFYQEQGSEGNKKLILQKDRFDNFVSTNFNDPQIEREATRVEIRNGTGKSGLASRASRTVANLGMEVVAIDNAELEDVPRTLIIDYTNKPESTLRLAYSFDGEIIKRPPEEGKRGDIVVVVGHNYYQKLNGLK